MVQEIERLEVEGALENLTIMALLNGISPQGLLMAKLARRAPATLQEFMNKAEEFICAEETIHAMVKSMSGLSSTPKKRNTQQEEGSSRKD